MLLVCTLHRLSKYMTCFCSSLVSPVFTKVPGKVTLFESSSTAVLVCEAFGFPPPVIEWIKAFSLLPQGRSVVVNGTLKISRFSLQDSGTYQCKASNRLGSVTFATSLLVGKIGRYHLLKWKFALHDLNASNDA